MLIVHHLGVSQSERIVWLCGELGIPYELKNYARDATTRLAPPDYKALHPMGTAPVITDGDLVLGESGAIMEYILGKYGDGGLVPKKADPSWPDYLYWLHFTNASLMPRESMANVTRRLVAEHPLKQAFQTRRDQAYAMVEERLGDSPYIAGKAFTAADIMLVFSLTTMRHFTGSKLDDYPNIRAYLARIGERPAYKAAMAKGDAGFTPMLA